MEAHDDVYFMQLATHGSANGNILGDCIDINIADNKKMLLAKNYLHHLFATSLLSLRHHKQALVVKTENGDLGLFLLFITKAMWNLICN